MSKNAIFSYFNDAVNRSLKAIPKYESRKSVIGAIAIRKDGTIVHSHNGGAKRHSPNSHAEARICRKIDADAVIYIARIRRDNYKLDLARPCIHCFNRMRAYKVSKVYYSISPNEYGVINDFDIKDDGDFYMPDFSSVNF